MKLWQTHFYDLDYHEYMVFTDWAVDEQDALDKFHAHAKKSGVSYHLAMARPVTVMGKEIFLKDVNME